MKLKINLEYKWEIYCISLFIIFQFSTYLEYHETIQRVIIISYVGIRRNVTNMTNGNQRRSIVEAGGASIMTPAGGEVPSPGLNYNHNGTNEDSQSS